jgi:hypothetical protein
MNRSGFTQKNNPLKDPGMPSKTEKRWWPLHGIHWDFISSMRFQKATHLMPSTTVLIFSQNFFHSARSLVGGDSLFMLAAQDLTPPEDAKLFAKKIASPYTHRTHLISHHQTFFSSEMSNFICRESFFHHVKNYRG